MRILVIEDNPKMAEAVQKGLLQHGFQVDVIPRGIDGEERAVVGEYDLIILDLLLPDRHGVEVCSNLRRRGVTTRVLMLTALESLQDKVHSLDSGADDYLVKPFDFDELLARIRALCRRGELAESRRLKCDDLELDLYQRRAYRNGATVALSSREFELLEFFMRHADQDLTRGAIEEGVWGRTEEPTSNVVDVYVNVLRTKIDRGVSNPLIHTVKGVGYRFGPCGKPAPLASAPAGGNRQSDD